MNWEAIGAAGEIAAAIGVIASLLYVATQVRYSNRASLVQAKLETTRFMTDFADVMLSNPELNDVMVKGHANYSSLSSQEAMLFLHLATKAFWFFSAGHFQYRQGTLSESDWHELRAVAHFWLKAPGCRDWWRLQGKALYGPEFVTFVEEEIETLSNESSG